MAAGALTAALDLLSATGRFALFSARVLARVPGPRAQVRESARQAVRTFRGCLLPVVAVTLPYGMVVSLQGVEIFRMFGAERLLGSLVSAAILRELSPVMASVLVAAQGGSAVAAELGSMRIKEEIDATEVMAVDPLREHVAPRVAGLLVATPLLNVAGSVAGLVGGYFTAVWIKGEPGGVFLAEMWGFLGPMDVWAGVLKTALFGLVIGLVAAWEGFHARGGAAGVGRAVNTTVVGSVLGLITLNYFLTSALYGGVAP